MKDPPKHAIKISDKHNLITGCNIKGYQQAINFTKETECNHVEDTNIYRSADENHTKWHQKPTVKIFTQIALLLIVAGIVYWLGWN